MSGFAILYIGLLILVAFKLWHASLQARICWGFYRQEAPRPFCTLMTSYAFVRHFGIIASLGTVYLMIPLIAEVSRF